MHEWYSQNVVKPKLLKIKYTLYRVTSACFKIILIRDITISVETRLWYTTTIIMY